MGWGGFSYAIRNPLTARGFFNLKLAVFFANACGFGIANALRVRAKPRVLRLLPIETLRILLRPAAGRV